RQAVRGGRASTAMTSTSWGAPGGRPSEVGMLGCPGESGYWLLFSVVSALSAALYPECCLSGAAMIASWPASWATFARTLKPGEEMPSSLVIRNRMVKVLLGSGSERLLCRARTRRGEWLGFR